MSRSRRPRRSEPVDVAERIFAAAFKSFEEAKPGKLVDSLGEIAAGAIRVAVICADDLVRNNPLWTGPRDDAAIADAVRDMAIRVLQDLRETGDSPLRDRFNW
jgi:hypothetical protein